MCVVYQANYHLHCHWVYLQTILLNYLKQKKDIWYSSRTIFFFFVSCCIRATVLSSWLAIIPIGIFPSTHPTQVLVPAFQDLFRKPDQLMPLATICQSSIKVTAICWWYDSRSEDPGGFAPVAEYYCTTEATKDLYWTFVVYIAQRRGINGQYINIAAFYYVIILKTLCILSMLISISTAFV